MISIDTIQKCEELILQSQDVPIVIFKHSTRCPISSGANEEMMMLDEECQDKPVKIGKILVVEHREVSLYCAERLGIKHESPQVIIVHHGKVTFNDSHHRVRYDKLEPIVAKLF